MRIVFLLLFSIIFCVSRAQTVDFENPDSLAFPSSEVFYQFDPTHAYVKLKASYFIDMTYQSDGSFLNPVAEMQFSYLISQFSVSRIYKTFRHLRNSNILGIYTIELQDSLLLGPLIQNLNQHPWIEYAEHIPYYHSFLQPNDSLYFPEQLYLHYMNADSAWNICTGSPAVKIAIVDDAVLTNHEDLIGQMWHNSGEMPNDSIDNDANGFIDDTLGYDVADLDNNVLPPNASIGHGTCVAGVAGATTNNQKGVASVAFNASVIPVKVKKDNSPGTILDSAMAGVEYAIIAGADIINMSFGSALYSQVFQDLCLVARDSGIVLVAAAGNSGTTDYFYPAAFDKVISVGATNHKF